MTRSSTNTPVAMANTSSADMLKIEMLRLGRFIALSHGASARVTSSTTRPSVSSWPAASGTGWNCGTSSPSNKRAVQRVEILDVGLALRHADPHVPPGNAGIVDHPVAQRRMPPDHETQVDLGEFGVAEDQADRPAGAVAPAEHPAGLERRARATGGAHAILAARHL